MATSYAALPSATRAKLAAAYRHGPRVPKRAINRIRARNLIAQGFLVDTEWSYYLAAVPWYESYRAWFRRAG